MAATPLKLNFGVVDRFGAFYTGGNVQISSDGEHLLCPCGTKVQILNTGSGKVVHSLEKDEDEVTCFCLSPDDEILVIAGKSLILRQWAWKEESITRSWKAVHTAPVSSMAYDCTSTLLATGSSDSTIKVWDIIKQYCTHNLRGHQGVVTAVEFHPDISRLQLCSAAEDYKIRLWDLQTSTCQAVLEIHFSAITCLRFTTDGHFLYSGGRDNIVAVTDMKEMKKVKTIPVYESLESFHLLPRGEDKPRLNVGGDSQFFVTAGNKGVLRVWNSQTAQCVFTQATPTAQAPATSSDEQREEEKSGALIVHMIYSAALDKMVTVTFDHNIFMHSMEDFTLHKQFVGYNDEILDIKFLGENDSHIAVATNSEHICVYELATWNCQMLRGHTDIVLSLDVQGHDLLASCSKDNTVRLWHLSADSGVVRCVGVGVGHTHAVTAVAFSRLHASFLVSGSEDLTLKTWPLPSATPDDSALLFTLQASFTEKAHDKDINSICVSPNDKLIATGSQDKTAKLWNAKTLALLGVMRGHKRSIWCVQFSPVDQCLASASADGCIKIWALSDYSCVKTFEGHSSSVLKVCFLSRGMQLLSSGSDGLIKLWTIKSNECVKTFDEHEGKAWALAVSKQEDMIITGAEDSTILKWEDRTEADELEAREKREVMILQEQQLSNLLHQKKYLKAIGLAITLDQPFRVLNVLKEILSSNGSVSLEETLKKLRMDQLGALLRFASTWNMNSKHCHVAQFVLNVVLRNYSPQELMQFPNIKSSVEGLLPYTERHFSRMSRLLQQSTFVDYTWQCMKLVAHNGVQPSVSMETEQTAVITAAEHETDDVNAQTDTAADTVPESHDITAESDDVIDSGSDDASSAETVMSDSHELVKEMSSPSDKENDHKRRKVSHQQTPTNWKTTEKPKTKSQKKQKKEKTPISKSVKKIATRTRHTKKTRKI